MTQVYKCDGVDCEEYVPVREAEDHNWKTVVDHYGEDGCEELHFCSWECVLATVREFVDTVESTIDEWLRSVILNMRGMFERLERRESDEPE